MLDDIPGIEYVVVSSLPGNPKQGKNPLDFFTLAVDRHSGKLKWIQWEWKNNVDGQLTVNEEQYLTECIQHGYKDVVRIGWKLTHILEAYGMV